jgi:hypothetical protein
MVSADAQVDARKDAKLQARAQAEFAYDSAVALYEAGKYRDAGVLFLKADLLEPSAAALTQAFKAYRHCGDQKMVEMLSNQFRYRYSDKRLAESLSKDGIVCVSKWEFEALQARLAIVQATIDDIVAGKRLAKLPANPYSK